MSAFSPPVIAHLAYPGLRWNFPPGERKIFITIDDGPSPETTPEILSILDEWKAQATFFCLGHQVEKYPELFQSIRNARHSIGNHSYSHPNGFTKSSAAYLEDVQRASSLIPSGLFRPPYGRIWPWQLKKIQLEFEVIMWSVMSMDYDPHYSEQDILRHLEKQTADGAILVFHENSRSAQRLPGILRAFLAGYSGLEYLFPAIPDPGQLQQNQTGEGG
jgi:peptidoglycan-N-acetylglucosamine deacetylase